MWTHIKASVIIHNYQVKGWAFSFKIANMLFCINKLIIWQLCSSIIHSQSIRSVLSLILCFHQTNALRFVSVILTGFWICSTRIRFFDVYYNFFSAILCATRKHLFAILPQDKPNIPKTVGKESPNWWLRVKLRETVSVSFKTKMHLISNLSWIIMWLWVVRNNYVRLLCS